MVGNRGLGAAEGQLLGSVPGEVVANAMCNVLIVQTTRHAEDLAAMTAAMEIGSPPRRRADGSCGSRGETTQDTEGTRDRRIARPSGIGVATRRGTANALTASVTTRRFTTAEGAGGHCEGRGQDRLDRFADGWLARTLARQPAATGS